MNETKKNVHNHTLIPFSLFQHLYMPKDWYRCDWEFWGQKADQKSNIILYSYSYPVVNISNLFCLNLFTIQK